jgi:hypothetical protein
MLEINISHFGHEIYCSKVFSIICQGCEHTSGKISEIPQNP